MEHSFRYLVLSVTSCSAIVFATKMQAQVTPNTPPAVRVGPGGSTNAVPSNVGEAQRLGVAPPASQPGVAVSATDLNRTIAMWIAMEHRQQVELGNLAREKTQAPKTKLLAIQTVDDNNRALAEIAALYPNPVAAVDTAGPALPRPIAPDRPEPTAPPTSTARSAPPVGGQTDNPISPTVSAAMNALELKHRVHDQFLSLAQRKLSENQGAEFDAAYVGMMLVKNQEMYATLQAFRDIASPELRKLIDAQMQTAQILYGRAEQLMPEVASQAVMARTPAAVPK